jgi:putative tryptophan/tyrosine transport system substrate-binding protein
MKRREFITLLGGAAIAWPLAARAQQPGNMLRVGALSAQPRAAPIWLAFERRMAELGYKHGTNFVLEFVQIDSIEITNAATASWLRARWTLCSPLARRSL